MPSKKTKIIVSTVVSVLVAAAIVVLAVMLSQKDPLTPITELALVTCTDTTMTLSWVKKVDKAMLTYTVNDGPPIPVKEISPQNGKLLTTYEITITNLLSGSQNTVNFITTLDKQEDKSQFIKVLTKPSPITEKAASTTADSIKLTWKTTNKNLTKTYKLNQELKLSNFSADGHS